MDVSGRPSDQVTGKSELVETAVRPVGASISFNARMHTRVVVVVSVSGDGESGTLTGQVGDSRRTQDGSALSARRDLGGRRGLTGVTKVCSACMNNLQAIQK
jgi:hypothetical protein